jgi:hypothetical protein
MKSMSIENTLERIAVALETLVAGQGLVSGTTVTVTPNENVSTEESREETKAEVTKPKRKPRKKKAEPEAPVEEPSEPEATIVEVRTALNRLQTAVDGAAARNVLSTVGGNGALSKVKPAKYQAVIDAANEAAVQAEAEAEIDG